MCCIQQTSTGTCQRFIIAPHTLYADIVRRHCTPTMYANNVRQQCTPTMYGDIVRRRCTPTMYANNVRRRCTVTLYAHDLRRQCTPTLYADDIGRQYTPTMYADIVRRRYTPTMYADDVRLRCTPTLYADNIRRTKKHRFCYIVEQIADSINSPGEPLYEQTENLGKKLHNPDGLICQSLFVEIIRWYTYTLNTYDVRRTSYVVHSDARRKVVVYTVHCISV